MTPEKNALRVIPGIYPPVETIKKPRISAAAAAIPPKTGPQNMEPTATGIKATPILSQPDETDKKRVNTTFRAIISPKKTIIFVFFNKTHPLLIMAAATLREKHSLCGNGMRQLHRKS